MIINRAYKYTYSSDTTPENLKNNISGIKSWKKTKIKKANKQTINPKVNSKADDGTRLNKRNVIMSTEALKPFNFQNLMNNSSSKAKGEIIYLAMHGKLN